MKGTSIIDIPKVKDRRGNLAILEGLTVPFDIKRVYYLYDVPSDSYRGAHAHKDQKALLIAVSGSFTVVVDNGQVKERIFLNKPDKGLLIDTMVWRELEDFSSGAVCLVLSSGAYDELDYIRDYDEFMSIVQGS